MVFDALWPPETQTADQITSCFDSKRQAAYQTIRASDLIEISQITLDLIFRTGPQLPEEMPL